MKIFLLILILLPLRSFACKPAPLPSCEAAPLKLDQDKFTQLLSKVRRYQRNLDMGVVEGPGHTSCFNNRFAVHYSELFLKELQKRDGKTCPHLASFVRDQILRLIAIDGPEIRSVQEKKVLLTLTKLRKQIQKDTHKLL